MVSQQQGSLQACVRMEPSLSVGYIAPAPSQHVAIFSQRQETRDDKCAGLRESLRLPKEQVRLVVLLSYFVAGRSSNLAARLTQHLAFFLQRRTVSPNADLSSSFRIHQGSAAADHTPMHNHVHRDGAERAQNCTTPTDQATCATFRGKRVQYLGLRGLCGLRWRGLRLQARNFRLPNQSIGVRSGFGGNAVAF